MTKVDTLSQETLPMSTAVQPACDQTSVQNRAKGEQVIKGKT